MAGDMKVISPKKLQTATAAETKAFNDDLAVLATMLWGYDWEESAPGYSVDDFENLSSSEYTRRLFSQSENVFVLGEDGKFQANTLESAEDLASYAASGRLYARDNENNLCQLLFVEDKNPGAKEGEKQTKPYLQLSEPIQPQAVPAPAWWKYILAIFSSRFSEEIQAYNNATVFNDALAKSGFINNNADREALQDDLKKFEKDLNEYAELQGNVIGAVWTKNRSAETILNAMHNTIRRNLAREILKSIKDNPEQKAEILAQNAATFETKLNEMKEYLTTLYDPKELENLVKLGSIARGAENAVLGMKFDFIAETALENFDNYVKAGRSDTFQPRRYAQTFKTIVDESKQEKKQPEPAKSVQQPKSKTEQQPVVTNPKDMDYDQFMSYLNNARVRGNNTDIKSVLESKHCSARTYFEAVARKIEGQVAGTMMKSLREAPNREELLQQQKELYIPLVADLSNFVVANTDVTTLANYCTGPRNPEDALKLQQSASDLLKNGVGKYLEETAKKNAEKAKENVEAAPQKQETSVEKDQSQPEKTGDTRSLS